MENKSFIDWLQHIKVKAKINAFIDTNINIDRNDLTVKTVNEEAHKAAKHEQEKELKEWLINNRYCIDHNIKERPIG